MIAPASERRTRKRPTLAQSNFATALIVLLSILLFPATLSTAAITCLCSFLHRELFTGDTTSSKIGKLQTVLITGARANKALTLVRAFKREGHRVVLAEEEKWGTFTCARFSSAVDKYFTLPDPLTQPSLYSHAIKRIISTERVDMWVPCSSVHATMVDSAVASEIREEHLGGFEGCKSFIPEPPIAGGLHWKDQFEELCKELQFAVPESKAVTRVSDAVDFLHSSETLSTRHRFLLKSLSLDDLGRDDFTLFPLSTRDATFNHLSHIPTPISEHHPFLLQRFLSGEEYCTHVAARGGKIIAFVACPSNPLLMRYCDVRTLKRGNVSKELEEWTQLFLDRYKGKLRREGKTGPEYELNGHFSFDFIIEGAGSTKMIYPLECNVRPHTAVVLFSDYPILASHYLGIATAIARPRPSAVPRSWIAHALPLSLARLLPRRLLPLVHPQLASTLYPPSADAYSDPTASPPPGAGPLRVLAGYLFGAEQDGIWDASDPVPFLVLCHIQWPWLLLRLMWRGVPWSRVNVSTSRVFEC